MAKKEHPPAFQFYVDDFASDGKVEAMDTTAVGAYILLICKAWKEKPVASLPDDSVTLAKWSRLPNEEWLKCSDKVLSCFTMKIDGRYHQKRLKKEYDKILAHRKERSASGKQGAKRRWGSDGTANGSAIRELMAKNSSSSSSSSSSSTTTSAVERELVQLLKDEAGIWSEIENLSPWSIVHAIESIKPGTKSASDYIFAKIRDQVKHVVIQPEKITALHKAGMIFGYGDSIAESPIKYSNNQIVIDEKRIAGPFSSEKLVWGIRDEQAVKSWVAARVSKAKAGAA